MASLDQLSDVFGQHRVADIQLLSKQLKFGFFQRHKQSIPALDGGLAE